jgi:hypothetical protein
MLMTRILLQFIGDRCDLLVTEQLDTEHDSPLCRSEVLHKHMADAQLDPQISFRPGLLQTPREERLRTRLPAEEGAKSRLSKNFRSRNDRPTTRAGKVASPLMP